MQCVEPYFMNFCLLDLAGAVFFFVCAGLFSVNFARLFTPRSTAAILAGFGGWLLFNQLAYLIPAVLGLTMDWPSLLIAALILTLVSFLLKKIKPASQEFSKIELTPVMLWVGAVIFFDGKILDLLFHPHSLGVDIDITLYHIPNSLVLIKDGFWSVTQVNYAAYFFGYEAFSFPLIQISGSLAPYFFSKYLFLALIPLAFELLRQTLFGRFRIASLNGLAAMGIFFGLAGALSNSVIGKNDMPQAALLLCGAAFILSAVKRNDADASWLPLFLATLFMALAATIKPPGGILALFILAGALMYGFLRADGKRAFSSIGRILSIFILLLLPILWFARSLYISSFGFYMGDGSSINSGFHDSPVAVFWDAWRTDSVAQFFNDRVLAAPFFMTIIILGPLVWIVAFILRLRLSFAFGLFGLASLLGIVLALVMPHAMPLWRPLGTPSRLFWSHLIVLAVLGMILFHDAKFLDEVHNHSPTPAPVPRRPTVVSALWISLLQMAIFVPLIFWIQKNMKMDNFLDPWGGEELPFMIF